jgi:hypothetical protein
MFVEAGPFLLDWNSFAANVNSGFSPAFCSAMDSNMIDMSNYVDLGFLAGRDTFSG